MDHSAVFAGNRAYGRVRLAVGLQAGRTRRRDVDEEGSLRVRFPASVVTEAVLINTAGGVAGGDHFTMDVTVANGSSLTVTTAAAEKVYRALGPASQIDIKLAVQAGGSLGWLPQETILFDRAQLNRTLTIDLAEDARLTLVEAVIFGRAAMGEYVTEGALAERWRIRRGGRLVYADGVRLDGDIGETLRHPASADGAGAMATIVICPGDEKLIEAIRSQESCFRGEVGISAWNGIAVARFIARDGAILRHDVLAVLDAFRCRVPRLWLN